MTKAELEAKVADLERQIEELKKIGKVENHYHYHYSGSYQYPYQYPYQFWYGATCISSGSTVSS